MRTRIPRLSSVRHLSLQTMETPNENALKFVVKGKQLLPAGVTDTVEIDNLADATDKSWLAAELFKIHGVKSLMIGPDFVTINKVDQELSHNEELCWASMTPRVTKVITESMNNHISALTESYREQLEKSLDELKDEDDDIVYEIKELINTRIRPALQDDGGDVHFRSFNEDTGTVFIKLKGACKSCSLSEDTLRNGIESMLVHYVPEVESVKAVLDPEEEIAMQEFEKFEARLKRR